MAHRRPELPDPPELSGVAGPRLPATYRAAFCAAFCAAFHGRPADGAAILRDSGLPTGGTPEGRWLMGVCLGALGHYRRAAGVLLPPGAEPDSLAASARASHLRQLGRHAEAEKLDTLAARLAPAGLDPAAAGADALVGLVADAVGRADPAAAATRLVAAREHVTGLDPVTYWRAHVRLGWVAAEDAML
ncbi:MAG TPA: hypothetical protein VFX70_05590, partial [Mycobacteriales bacterium]|nr:hypothetical protein [Mycobacteriales bacterium]